MDPKYLGLIEKVNWLVNSFVQLQRRFGYLEAIESTENQVPSTQILLGGIDGLVQSSPNFIYDPTNNLFNITFPNQSSISIDDTNNTVVINGNKKLTTSSVTFTGSGLNDMALTGNGSVTGPISYSVTIDGVNYYSVLGVSAVTGHATQGDTIIGTITGAVGVFALAASSVYYIRITSGDFTGESAFTNVTSPGNFGTVRSVVTNGVDSFSFTDGTTTSHKNPITGAATQALTYGVTIQFTGVTGHTLNNTWSWNYTYVFGRMLDFEGINNFFAFGDIDNVSNGTAISVVDNSKYTSITNAISFSTMQQVIGNSVAVGPTIQNGVRGMYYDPSVVIAAETITLPTGAPDGVELVLYFGKIITTGTVITALTIVASGGDSVVGLTTPFTATVQTIIRAKYRSAATTWYVTI